MANRPAADDNRCARTGGRQWRCPFPRFGGTRYCEKHHLYKLQSRSNSKSRVKVSGRPSKKKKQRVSKNSNFEGEKDWNTDDEDSSSSEIDKRGPATAWVFNPCAVKKKSEGSSSAIRVPELGQVWAFAEESDGFPRSYARIDHITPIQSLARVTPLVPYPESREEMTIAEQGLSLACGLFKASESCLTKEICEFSHNVQFEKEGGRGLYYRVFPRNGEIWAVYSKWDSSKNGFEFKLVEVVSDFDEEDGVNVYALVRVEGKDGVYQRQMRGGFHLIRSYSRSFMPMFSHQLPASRLVEGMPKA